MYVLLVYVRTSSLDIDSGLLCCYFVTLYIIIEVHYYTVYYYSNSTYTSCKLQGLR